MELQLFNGSFAMSRQRRHQGEKLQFPRKKLRYQLTHYELGKVTKGLWESLPEEDPVPKLVSTVDLHERNLSPYLLP